MKIKIVMQIMHLGKAKFYFEFVSKNKVVNYGCFLEKMAKKYKNLNKFIIHNEIEKMVEYINDINDDDYLLIFNTSPSTYIHLSNINVIFEIEQHTDYGNAKIVKRDNEIATKAYNLLKRLKDRLFYRLEEVNEIIKPLEYKGVKDEYGK